MASALVWFRRALRLHDNAALVEACKAATVVPLFVIDSHVFNEERMGANRAGFILECLHDLDEALRSRNSRLVVITGDPVEIVPTLVKELDVSDVYFERETEAYARQRDEVVLAHLEKLERPPKIHTPSWPTLWDPERLLAVAGGKPPPTMQSFLGVVSRAGRVAEPVAAPSSLPPLHELATSRKFLTQAIPTLEELGYKEEKTSFLRGGEAEALRILEKYLEDTSRVVKFEKPKTTPAAVRPGDTTGLSAHVSQGALSARTFYYGILEVVNKNGSKCTSPPVSLIGQLLWREFFTLASYGTPNFDQMEGNRVCRQIPWDDDPVLLDAWREARTGYPWIDAIMTQLREQGWMHHLARHSVACFLTRGDLWQSWEKGASHFDRLLVDLDWGLNAGNWMWLSASAYFSAYLRVYSPVAFGKKWDPKGEYVRHFLPILRKFPDKYIYEPWNAPLSIQRDCGCIIGKDYPQPIVEHKTASKRNIGRMAEAYKLKRYGDPRAPGQRGAAAPVGGRRDDPPPAWTPAARDEHLAKKRRKE